MGNPSTAQEPSMEEILASIRQIISEDGDAPSGGRGETIDELGNRIDNAAAKTASPRPEESAPRHRTIETAGGSEQQTGSAPFGGGVMKSTSASAAKAAPPPIPAAAVETAPQDFAAAGKSRAVATQRANSPADDSRLLSEGSDTAVAGAFSALAHTILAQNARTLEDLVSEMLQPMLREWLDDNLPNLVERIVQEEIQRVSRGRR
jgi:uncharacterized protein